MVTATQMARKFVQFSLHNLREMTMAEKIKCELCDKDAIGIQSLGTCVSYLCEDHADSSLLALRPGEKRAYDYCYLERFSPTKD